MDSTGCQVHVVAFDPIVPELSEGMLWLLLNGSVRLSAFLPHLTLSPIGGETCWSSRAAARSLLPRDARCVSAPGFVAEISVGTWSSGPRSPG